MQSSRGGCSAAGAAETTNNRATLAESDVGEQRNGMEKFDRWKLPDLIQVDISGYPLSRINGQAAATLHR